MSVDIRILSTLKCGYCRSTYEKFYFISLYPKLKIEETSRNSYIKIIGAETSKVLRCTFYCIKCPDFIKAKVPEQAQAEFVVRVKELNKLIGELQDAKR